MPVGKRLKVVMILAVVAVLSLSWISMPTPGDQEVSSFNEVEPSLVIFRDGQETKCQDVSSGRILSSSIQSSQVIQGAMDALPFGGAVLVKAGDYDLSSQVELPSNTQIMGEGPGTIFRGQTPISFLIQESGNVTLGDFRLLGSGGIMIAGKNAPAHDVLIHDVTATIGALAEGMFYTLALNTNVYNISFVRCTALNCGTNGFINSGQVTGGWVENISYLDCKAIGCGSGSRYNNWVVGFDLAERVNIKNMRVQGCEASNNWQSGFHFEMDETVLNATLLDCVANNNGQAKGAPSEEGYGWGYLVFKDEPSHDIRLHQCRADGNWRGDTNLGPLVQVQG